MKIALPASALALAVLSLASFQALAADSCPQERTLLIRLSTLKPDGTKAGFDKAVADNNAWYRAHGVKHGEQIAGTVVTYDEKNNPVAKPGEVATVHVAPSPGQAPPDDAWKAFVAEYDKNSTITQKLAICLDKPLK